MGTWKDKTAANAWRRAWRVRRREAGLCHRCGKAVAPGYRRCAPCLQKDRDYRDRMRETNKQFRAISRAFERGTAEFKRKQAEREARRAAAKKRMAAIRVEWRRRKNAERRAAGLCIDCGEPSNGKQCCEEHRLKRVEAWKRKRARERGEGTEVVTMKGAA